MAAMKTAMTAAASASSDSPEVPSRQSSLMAANRDLALYLSQLVVGVNAHPLMPDKDGDELFCPQAEWANGNCVPEGVSMKPRLDGYTKKRSFLAASAIALLGGVASSTHTERTFRNVSFINNVLRQMMLPETIARAPLLRRNRAMRRSIADIATEYKKHPESRRRGYKRAVITTETIEV